MATAAREKLLYQPSALPIHATLVRLRGFSRGAYNSIAYGVSADGSIVVGPAYPGTFDDGTHEAFSWTAKTGLVHLSFAPGDDWSMRLLQDPLTNDYSLPGDSQIDLDERGSRSKHAPAAGDSRVPDAGAKQ